MQEGGRRKISFRRKTCLALVQLINAVVVISSIVLSLKLVSLSAASLGDAMSDQEYLDKGYQGVVWMMIFAVVIGPLMAACAAISAILYPVTALLTAVVFVVTSNMSAVLGRIFVPLWIPGGTCCSETVSGVPFFLLGSGGCLAIGALFALGSLPFFFVIESWLSRRAIYWWGRHFWRVITATGVISLLLVNLWSKGAITLFAVACAIAAIFLIFFLTLLALANVMASFEQTSLPRIRAFLACRLSGIALGS